jgi:hypothetical protein
MADPHAPDREMREFGPSFRSPAFVIVSSLCFLAALIVLLIGVFALIQGSSATAAVICAFFTILIGATPFILRLPAGVRVDSDGSVYVHLPQKGRDGVKRDEVEYVLYKSSTGYLVGPNAQIVATLPSYLARHQVQEIAQLIGRPMRER